MKKAIILLLSLLSTRAVAQTELIQNGNFSSLSSSWSTSGNWYISSSFSCYSSASAYAYFGDAAGSPVNYGNGSVYQQITIPSSASSATLTFKVSINTFETTSSTAYDLLDVQLRSTSQSLLYTFDNFSNLDGNSLPGCQGYQLKSYNVPSSYFGQTIRVNFQGATDYADGTVFRIDDVSLTYISSPQNGTVNVTINPSAAIAAGATWQLDGTGSWNASGNPVTASAGNHFVNYNLSVPGWIAPANQNITVVANQTANQAGTYTQSPQNGTVNVTINPSAAIAAGATWQLDGTGSWNASGNPVTASAGNHFVNYNPSVPGWTAPANQNITVVANQTTNQSGTYTQSPQNGTVNVTINPSAAIAAGATWQLDGTGSWNASGNPVTASAGNHFVNYNLSVPGWIAPANQNITVVANQTAFGTGTYTQTPTTTFLNFSSPLGGETWAGGSVQTISGTVSNDITSIVLEYSNNNGATWFSINTISPSAGTFSYNWTIPFTPSINSLVKATGFTPQGPFPRVSNSFTITVNCFPYTSLPSPYGDYPYTNASTSDCVVNSQLLNCPNSPDAWSLCKYECTSWVAWCMNKAMGVTDTIAANYHPFTDDNVEGNSLHLGNAGDWMTALTQFYPCNMTPIAGSIAWYSNSSSLGGGHVAFVNCVTNGVVTVTEFNHNLQPCMYLVRIIDMNLPDGTGMPGGYANRIPTCFIHILSGVGGVGISSQAEPEPRFAIFPNPANNQINFAVNDTAFQHLDIYNSIGELVQSISVINQTLININTAGMPEGFYFARLYGEAEVSTQKFEVVH